MFDYHDLCFEADISELAVKLGINLSAALCVATSIGFKNVSLLLSH